MTETVTAINAAITAYSALKDLVSAGINLRDAGKFAAFKLELTEKLLAAQSELLQVQSAIVSQNALVGTLEKRIGELESQEREKARYHLGKLGGFGDFFAYRLRPASELAERVDEPVHFVCQPCFDVGKKGILQGGSDGVWFCPLCKIKLVTEPVRPAKPTAFIF